MAFIGHFFFSQLEDLDFADDLALLLHKYIQMQKKDNFAVQNIRRDRRSEDHRTQDQPEKRLIFQWKQMGNPLKKLKQSYASVLQIRSMAPRHWEWQGNANRRFRPSSITVWGKYSTLDGQKKNRNADELWQRAKIKKTKTNKQTKKSTVFI